MLEIKEILQLKEEFVLYKLDVDKGMFWLFNIDNGDSFKLNEISYNILSLIDNDRSVGKIKENILGKYPDIDADAVLKDLEELIIEMKKHQIFNIRN